MCTFFHTFVGRFCPELQKCVLVTHMCTMNTYVYYEHICVL